MFRSLTLLLLLMNSLLGAGPIWVLSWSDEFNTPLNTAPDAAKWTYDIGAGGWGNGESQYYTNRTVNARTDGTGNLIIQAQAESYMGASYTSARLKTQGVFTQAYGRFECRMRMTYSQGIWPAFWMLGQNIGGVGWPNCGEIDIMENVGYEPTITHGTIHGPGYSGGGAVGMAYDYGAPLAAAFHEYAVEWEPGIIRWYFDGILFQTRTQADIGANTWVFTQPFFMILNVAVGGTWPGYPDGSTVLPQQLLVDYVRVYTRDTTQQPYSGSALPIPGTIQFEQFDDGGPGVAYSDTSVINNGTTRTSDAVDLEATTDAGGGYNLGWSEAGEWMEYTVNVASTGNYALDMRVAKQGAGGTLHLEVDGVPLANSNFTVPDTGGWQAWQTLAAQTVALTAGTHVIRVVFDTVGTGGSVGNFNWFRFTSLSTPTPSRTNSPTLTRSPTRTDTPTPTPSFTVTLTPSPTPSQTATLTFSESPSETLTATPPLPGSSETDTPTLSPTETATLTLTVTPTWTLTETLTPGPTATMTFTPSTLR